MPWIAPEPPDDPPSPDTGGIRPIIHLVEEWARHDGHADLIRQAIDGATGR